MEQNPIKTTHICSYCKQELPLENFYIRKGKQQPDNYCKECRRIKTLVHKKSKSTSRPKNNAPQRVVITSVLDREERMRLILQARQKVNESIARKKRMVAEAEMKAMDAIDARDG
ncbi:hypothetical protein [Bacteroides sp. UBA939]|uniref:hypothetical protein n=1 Tax=Bacteroides sp. UBA939 TaxID=1946092 RepID=UPI0025B9A259|nr:hypothetical protein [Bacteroides sp. UBA939]